MPQEEDILKKFANIFGRDSKQNSRRKSNSSLLSALEKIKDKDLERLGMQVFETMGLNCFDPKQVQLKELDGNRSSNENFELDYVIPQGEFCLIGEITSRKDKSDIEGKYKKFCDQIHLLAHYISDPKIWKILGITSDIDLRKFKDVRCIRGFFVSNQRETDSLSLNKDDHVKVFCQSNFLTLIEYAITTGKWSRPYFLDLFNIKAKNQDAIRISTEDNSLIRMKQRKVSSGNNVPNADLYIFETSPYKLLEISKVYREDRLPKIEERQQYQRALIPEKLHEIRQKLLINPGFIFPSNILVTLSKDCRYDESEKELIIPCKYGAISIIDGQHRLFSYADESIKNKCLEESRILVSGLKFQTENEKEIEKCSVQVFVEINATQTRIDTLHLYLLGDTSPETLAAKTIQNFNNRKGKYKYMFKMKGDGSQVNTGIVEDNPVRKSLEMIVNLNSIKQSIEEESNRFKGYKNFCLGHDLGINSLDCEEDVERLITSFTRGIERYFNTIFKIFEHDDFLKKQDINTSFTRGNFLAAFILLLNLFIEEGLTWEQIKYNLVSLKENALENGGIKDYNDVLFIPDRLSILFANEGSSKISATKKPQTIFKYLKSLIETTEGDRLSDVDASEDSQS